MNQTYSQTNAIYLKQIPLMAKLNVQHPLLQYLVKEIIIICLKQLLNIFVETVMHSFLDSLMNRKFKRLLFKIDVLYNIINIVTVTFDTFKVSQLNKNIKLLFYFILQTSN